MPKAPHLPNKTRKKRPWILRILLRLFVFCLVVGILCTAVFCAYYGIRASKFDLDGVAVMPERTKILDRNGKGIGQVHGENRDVVTIEEMSDNFLKSIIAREDNRFYDHPGVDFKGLARAFVRNVKDRRMTQGASTITMQLARNTFDLSDGEEWYHELDRKFLEIFVTLRIERRYEKREILQHYCNRIFWGHSMMGIEAASQAYLEKPAKDLTLSEGAMLAGIVRGPNAFSPFRSVDAARKERNVVLGRLKHYGYITEEEEQAAIAEPLRIRPKKQRDRGQSYAMDATLKELNRILEEQNFKIGGLTVFTTLDKDLQEVAEQSVNNRLVLVEKTPGYKHQTKWAFQNTNTDKTPSYIQGALVLIDNKTGGIVASVGGRDPDDSRFNRAYNARRQVGSIFKPFVFQAAFDRGLRPETFINDGPIKPKEIDYAKENWKPQNSDGKNLGLIATRTALLRSRNTSSVRVGDYAGLPYVVQAAEAANFSKFQWDQQKKGKTPKTAGAYLGDWEASPFEVARAYTIFPNQGTIRQPFIIAKVVNQSGKVIYSRKAGLTLENPISKGATYEVSKILQEVNISGTGSAVKNTYGITAPSGGKTGTTNDYKDAWYAGYTSRLTCAVWVGLDTPKRTVNNGYGGKLALPIWADVMRAASKKSEFAPGSLASNLPSTKIRLCKRSGKLANSACDHYGEAYDDFVTNDLVQRVNTPCTIHSGRAITQTIPEPVKKPTKVEPEESAEGVIGGLFNRIFGGGKKKPDPASSNSTKSRTKTPPQRAIIVEEPVRNTPPPRAIVVEDPQPTTTSQRRPIKVFPRIDPRVQNRTVQPQRPRAQRPSQPQRAIVVEEQRRPRATPPPPQRAVIVEELAVPTPPQRAIVVD